MPTRRLLPALVLCLAAAPAGAETLAELLAAAADNERFEPAVRADVQIACQPKCEPTAARAIFVGRGDALYVEVKDGIRALVRPGDVKVAEANGAKPAKPEAALAGSDVLLEDLAVFTATSLKLPQISDQGPTETVVTAAPSGPSAYVLLVHTIAPHEHTITRTQYYRELVGNLLKMRRNTDFVEVAGHRRPQEIAVQSFRRGTTTRLTLAWRAFPEAPAALFTPDGLTRPSGLPWPEP
jgi:hypothetical protein